MPPFAYFYAIFNSAWVFVCGFAEIRFRAKLIEKKLKSIFGKNYSKTVQDEDSKMQLEVQ